MAMLHYVTEVGSAPGPSLVVGAAPRGPAGLAPCGTCCRHGSESWWAKVLGSIRAC